MPPSKEISATHWAKFSMLVNILLFVLRCVCVCYCFYMFMFLSWLFNVWTLVWAALFFLRSSCPEKTLLFFFYLYFVRLSSARNRCGKIQSVSCSLSLSLSLALPLLAACVCACVLRLIASAVCRAVEAVVVSSRAMCIAFYSTHNQTSSVSRPVIREATPPTTMYCGLQQNIVWFGFCAFSFNLILLLFIKFTLDYRHW